MSGLRIVEETPCEHGQMESHVWFTPKQRLARDCPGGSRRVLTEGQYVLVEKVDGEWDYSAWSRAFAPAFADATYNALDALSDHTEGTP